MTTKLIPIRFWRCILAFRTSRSDIEAAMRQLLAHPAKTETPSENRMPTVKELSRRGEMKRRA